MPKKSVFEILSEKKKELDRWNMHWTQYEEYIRNTSKKMEAINADFLDGLKKKYQNVKVASFAVEDFPEQAVAPSKLRYFARKKEQKKLKEAQEKYGTRKKILRE